SARSAARSRSGRNVRGARGPRCGRPCRDLGRLLDRRRGAHRYRVEILEHAGRRRGRRSAEMSDAAENAGQTRWVARLIAAGAERPFLTILCVLALAAWGWVALERAPLDAIPDLSDVQVIVFTEWPGQSPDLVEDQVTYPISTALVAAPKVQAV